MKLSDIKPNPNNPRVIKDDAFEKLCNSIKEFPKMMALRPMVVDQDNVVLGGNMRLKALQHLGFKEIPDEWVRKASELIEEEKRRFIIADNVSGGDWDWGVLQADWDVAQLEDWGWTYPTTKLSSRKRLKMTTRYRMRLKRILCLVICLRWANTGFCAGIAPTAIRWRS